MKNKVVISLKIVVGIALFFCFVLGVTYIQLITQSEREIWRITDYEVSNPIIVKNLLLFEGYKADRSLSCDCIYAVDKTTGEISWSTEEFAVPYIEETKNSGHGSESAFSVFTRILTVSETDDVIYMSLNYWSSYETINYVLFAIRSNDGQVIWKVDGEAGFYPLKDSIAEMNRIFLVNNKGDLLAIDSITGQELWQRNVYQHYDRDESWISYHKNIVFFSTFSSECLKPHCTFWSDLQHYEQIKALNAITGEELWLTNQLYSGRINIFDNILLVTARPWENSTDQYERYKYLVSAIDVGTGEKVWELSFSRATDFPEINVIENEILLFVESFENTGKTYHELAKLVVLDESTGKLIWQFNEDFSHGDISYHIEEGIVYIGTEDGFIHALDRKNGNEYWQAKTVYFPKHFIIDGDILITAYKENYLSASNINTGSQNWLLNLGDEDSLNALFSTTVVSENGIFYAVCDTKLCAFDVHTGKMIWSWEHNHPMGYGYDVLLVENNSLYVDQWIRSDILSEFFGSNWFFALKTDALN